MINLTQLLYMKIRHVYIFILGLFLIFCGCNSNHTTKETKPVKKEKEQLNYQVEKPNYLVAVKFINDYQDFITSRHHMDMLDWVESRSDVSDALKHKLKILIEEKKKNEPEYGLGFDPIIQGQDIPDSLLVLRKEGEYIVFSGSRDWPDYEVTLKLKQIDRNWLVDGSGIVNIPKEKQSKR